MVRNGGQNLDVFEYRVNKSSLLLECGAWERDQAWLHVFSLSNLQSKDEIAGTSDADYERDRFEGEI